jgi:hypothetical protein
MSRGEWKSLFSRVAVNLCEAKDFVGMQVFLWGQIDSLLCSE